MSVILEFTAERSRRVIRPIEPEEKRGEILFFTGVRIERHVEDIVPPRRGDNHTAKDGTAKSGRRRKA